MQVADKVHIYTAVFVYRFVDGGRIIIIIGMKFTSPAAADGIIMYGTSI